MQLESWVLQGCSMPETKCNEIKGPVCRIWHDLIWFNKSCGFLVCRQAHTCSAWNIVHVRRCSHLAAVLDNWLYTEAWCGSSNSLTLRFVLMIEEIDGGSKDLYGKVAVGHWQAWDLKCNSTMSCFFWKSQAFTFTHRSALTSQWGPKQLWVTRKTRWDSVYVVGVFSN